MWPFHRHRRLKNIERLVERSVALQCESLFVLKRIEDKLGPKPEVRSFIITQRTEGETNMADQQPVKGIVPGTSATFDATPQDAAGNTITEPVGTVPTWISSDPVNAPVVASTDGLSASITASPTAPLNTTFTLSVSLTNADGTVANGSTPVPFIAASVVVASFVITQR